MNTQPIPPLTEGAAWRALQAHAASLRPLHLRELFAADPARGERLALQAAGIYLDYSKNRITDETIPVEEVSIMVPAADATGIERPDSIPAHDEYRATMAGVPFTEIPRWDFYELAKSSDVTVYIASGDQRLYANVMLTVGVRTADQ